MNLSRKIADRDAEYLERSNSCVLCGNKRHSISLKVSEVDLFGNTSVTSLEAQTILCASCFSKFSQQPREIEFTAFLVDQLSKHPLYSEVVQEPVIEGYERFRPDILVKRTSNVDESLIIECKAPAVIDSTQVSIAAHELIKYASKLPDSRPVLAVPSTLTDDQRSILVEAGVEIWDLPVLARIFGDGLAPEDSNFYALLLRFHLQGEQCQTREQQLISRLSSYRPGRQDWLLYQKLIGEILEHLFYPPLNKPISELPDKPRVNRRDFIIANHADVGFWAFMRDKYQADYIVVDAKNHSEKVGKEDILQVANYLKPHGAGLFGIICSRYGGDEHGCEHTLREQWLVHQKLILVLNDSDLTAMLKARSEQRKPEDVLAAKIEGFRLSM